LVVSKKPLYGAFFTSVGSAWPVSRTLAVRGPRLGPVDYFFACAIGLMLKRGMIA
jgi:hypothetical protein